MKLYTLLFLLPCFVMAMKEEQEDFEKKLEKDEQRSINKEISQSRAEFLAQCKEFKEDKDQVIIQYVFGQMSKEEFERSDVLSEGEKECINNAMNTPDIIESVPFGGRTTRRDTVKKYFDL